jgi:hypothetical protein
LSRAPHFGHFGDGDIALALSEMTFLHFGQVAMYLSGFNRGGVFTFFDFRALA